MQSSKDQLAFATQKVGFSRQNAIAKASRNKELIYNKLPILIEYDNKIINCGTARTGFVVTGDFANANIKKEELNQLELEREKIITDAGYSLSTLLPP